MRIVFFLLFFITISHVWAYNRDLEPVLSTKPSIDVTQYVLITHNNLSETLKYIDKIENTILISSETDLTKKIRIVHLHYMRAYAYVFHNRQSVTRTKRKAYNQIIHVISLAQPILEQNPQYSDLRRVVAVSMMLFVKTGSLGNFFKYKKQAIELAEQSIELDANNPMARVVLNNFDSLGIKLIGSNASRGLNLIDIPIQTSWTKPHLFEFYISQVHAFTKQRNIPRKKQAFQDAKDLFPKSWRLKDLEKRL